MEFRTVLLLARKTATGIEVPPEVVEALASGRKPAVTVTINGGHSYPSTVASMGGKFLVPVSAEHRAAAGVQAGDEVLVDLVLDTAPRVLVVPEDLAAGLDADPAARAAFDGLSHSNQRRHVLSVEGAKTPETRARRVAKVVEELTGDPVVDRPDHGWPTQGPASYFPSIEKKYGRSIATWQAVIAGHDTDKHMQLVAHLKSEHGMGHGHANALVGWTLAGNVAKE